MCLRITIGRWTRFGRSVGSRRRRWVLRSSAGPVGWVSSSFCFTGKFFFKTDGTGRDGKTKLLSLHRPTPSLHALPLFTVHPPFFLVQIFFFYMSGREYGGVTQTQSISVCHQKIHHTQLTKTTTSSLSPPIFVTTSGMTRHFWKRRQVIAERLRDRLSRRRQPATTTQAAPEGTSSAIAAHPSSDAAVGREGAITPSGASVISGRGVGVGGGATPNNNNGNNSSDHLQLPSSQQDGQRRQDSSGDYNCQDMEGEVGLTGIICRYDDEEGGSTIGQGSRRSRLQQSSA